MNSELERTIIKYYPQRALVSPIENDAIAWDYDTGYRTLKAILAELKTLEPTVRPGTRGRYDISEELILGGDLHLQLCYIGPFAAMNYGFERDLDEDERDLVRQVERLLEKHGVMVLEAGQLDELVPWIREGTHAQRSATVWNCLFVHPEG